MVNFTQFHGLTCALALAISMAISMAGCGTSDTSSSSVSSPEQPAMELGSRQVPQGLVTVSAPAGIGSSVTIFRVTVSGTNQIPTQISARIGSTYDDNATLREATLVSAGTFEVEFPTPSIIAGAHVWVRATYPDGSVCETGADDFGL